MMRYVNYEIMNYRSILHSVAFVFWVDLTS